MQVGYVRAREGGALLGQENTEPRAFEMARHWVADFWVVHHLGRAPMRLVRAQLGCAQMGNAVKDQCHSAVTVAAWVGAHLGCALQRVALVYRRAKKWRSTGYKPPCIMIEKPRIRKTFETETRCKIWADLSIEQFSLPTCKLSVFGSHSAHFLHFRLAYYYYDSAPTES